MHLNCTGSYKNPRYLPLIYHSRAMRIICPEYGKIVDGPASREVSGFPNMYDYFMTHLKALHLE